MKLSHLYNQAIKLGRRFDPRGNHPWQYADSAILYGKQGIDVKKIMVGIDIEVPELLLADRLRQNNGLDLVVSHHPEGRALAGFFKVMQVQIDMLTKVGIEATVAQQLVEERMNEVARNISPVNHMRAVDAARLLNLPFMCIHTPADNLVSFFLQRLFKKAQPKRLEEIVDLLETIPEYQQAKRSHNEPRIILGNPRRPAGKIFVEMTGGTEGSKEAFGRLAKKGIRTLVSMHLTEAHFKKVRDADLNVVIAGHISSDTLGLNLLLDLIEKEEPLQIITCSGFRRIRHNLNGKIYP